MTGLITTDKLLDVTVTIKYELLSPPSPHRFRFKKKEKEQYISVGTVRKC